MMETRLCFLPSLLVPLSTSAGTQSQTDPHPLPPETYPSHPLDPSPVEGPPPTHPSPIPRSPYPQDQHPSLAFGAYHPPIPGEPHRRGYPQRRLRRIRATRPRESATRGSWADHANIRTPTPEEALQDALAIILGHWEGDLDLLVTSVRRAVLWYLASVGRTL
ncbi:E4 [Trichechus manatus latirostris papillomavirus 1]|uniref:E4 n=1 Tax=Trichechus manatus papillomavirus 1 TaxID=291589 RepID=Q5UUY1_9PAPI|nr:E4 [Trichechus manatus latirostris papillomavirus 1]AAU11450.1 E4 [Trichechus manatus latirostris papillomavirus 1]